MNEECASKGYPDLSNINPHTSPLFAPRDYGLSTVLEHLYSEMYYQVGIVERSIIDLLVVNKLSDEVNKYEIIRENSGLFISHLNNIVYFFKILHCYLERENGFNNLKSDAFGHANYYRRCSKEHLLLALVSYFFSKPSANLGAISPIYIIRFLQMEFRVGYIVDYNNRSDPIAQVCFSICSAFAMLIHSCEYKENERNIVDALKWFKCGVLNNHYFIANGHIPEYLT